MYVGLHYLFVIYSNGIICKLIYMCTFLLTFSTQLIMYVFSDLIVIYFIGTMYSFLAASELAFFPFYMCACLLAY